MLALSRSHLAGFDSLTQLGYLIMCSSKTANICFFTKASVRQSLNSLLHYSMERVEQATRNFKFVKLIYTQVDGSAKTNWPCPYPVCSTCTGTHLARTCFGGRIWVHSLALFVCTVSSLSRICIVNSLELSSFPTRIVDDSQRKSILFCF